MHGMAFVFLTLAFPSEYSELPSDVEEIHARHFALPLHIDPERKEAIKRIVLYVSEDRGKTWKHSGDYKTTDDEMRFHAPKDGLYWFALQVESSEGKIQPEKTADLSPGMKVYVNAEQKSLKVHKSHDQLAREVKELRKTV